jgi:hypothetical protein
MLDKYGLRASGDSLGSISYHSTGNPLKLQALLPKLIGIQGDVKSLSWHDGDLLDL